MESIYLISLIVGGFFGALSMLGGDTHSDADFDAGFDADVDLDVDLDLDLDAGTELDADLSGIGGHAGGIGVVDLLSVRTLFLFAAFFGLTGVLLGMAGTAEPLTGILSATTGLIVGMGGNYVIKKFAYQSVSSAVTEEHMKGKTGRVILPFGHDDTGKILIEARGKRVQLIAKSLDDNPGESFAQDEEVVVVRVDGRVAEVVKPT